MDDEDVPTVYVVSMVEHMGDSWPMKAFRSEADAAAFRDAESEHYETETVDSGAEVLVDEQGNRYSIVVTPVEWGSEERTVGAPEN